MSKTGDPFADLPGGLKLFLCNLHSLVPTKLEDNNYPSWSSTVKATLVAHRLFEYVDGTLMPPPTTIPNEKAPAAADKEPAVKPNPAYEQWSIIDAQLRASLLAILSRSVQNLVHLCPTASAIWDHLHQRYIDGALKLVTALALAREPVPEQDVILSVLRGLPSEYASLKQNIRTNIAKLTFNEVSSWLLSEELNVQIEQNLHLGSSSSGSTELPTALYANSYRDGGQRGRGRGRGRGRMTGNKGGGRFGGRASYAQPDGRGRGSAPRNPSLICQICGRSNHGAWQCWNRYDEEYSGPPSAPHNAHALYSAHSADINQNWHLDSGASTHVTSDLSRLHNPSPYHGSNSVFTAGGHSLPISHIGSGQVTTPSGISDPGQSYQPSHIPGPM
ncbi:unnamed protein product [Cuscuta campestris]|uniref:Retrotransposon Copia-like N-terminal domain-containing protein n=1 Tax=Cuscuta campestris TaxID=132261 RepID=A0A484NQ83_9ASTE|nr:unnamed protein product [Cuscuta campestris]